MNTTSSHSGSPSVLLAAKEGFLAIGKKPARLVLMAVLVSLPHILYGLFVRGLLLSGHSMDSGLTGSLPGLTSVPLLLKPINLVAIVLLFLSLLLLRPIWIRICLRLCGADSPRPNLQTYINFAAANILQFLVVSVVALFLGLFISLTHDLVQAAVSAACILIISATLLYFVFFPYLIVNQGRGPIQALKESCKLVKGNFWLLFGCGAVFMLCAAILNSVPLGLILLEVLFGTTTAMVYARLAGKA